MPPPPRWNNINNTAKPNLPLTIAASQVVHGIRVLCNERAPAIEYEYSADAIRSAAFRGGGVMELDGVSWCMSVGEQLQLHHFEVEGEGGDPMECERGAARMTPPSFTAAQLRQFPIIGTGCEGSVRAFGKYALKVLDFDKISTNMLVHELLTAKALSEQPSEYLVPLECIGALRHPDNSAKADIVLQMPRMVCDTKMLFDMLQSEMRDRSADDKYVFLRHFLVVFAHDVLHGLDHLSSATQRVHNDLKRDNVLLSFESDGVRFKVADYGCSLPIRKPFPSSNTCGSWESLDSSSSGLSPFMSDMTLGETASEEHLQLQPIAGHDGIGNGLHRAPELDGGGFCSERSDVWALGVMLEEFVDNMLHVTAGHDVRERRSRRSHRQKADSSGSASAGRVRDPNHVTGSSDQPSTGCGFNAHERREAERIRRRERVLRKCREIDPLLCDFMGRCLQVEPSNRASTQELLCHEWCATRKELDECRGWLLLKCEAWFPEQQLTEKIRGVVRKHLNALKRQEQRKRHQRRACSNPNSAALTAAIAVAASPISSDSSSPMSKLITPTRSRGPFPFSQEPHATRGRRQQSIKWKRMIPRHGGTRQSQPL